MKRQNEKGFSLVELLVVMAIMGILIGLAIAGLNIARRNARDTTRKADMQNLRILIEDYYLTNKHYPEGGTIKDTATGVQIVGGKELVFEFGGNVSALDDDCGDYDEDAETSPDDMDICYQAGTGRVQSYTLRVILEAGGVFQVAEEEE